MICAAPAAAIVAETVRARPGRDGPGAARATQRLRPGKNFKLAGRSRGGGFNVWPPRGSNGYRSL
eukprot:759850-Hanusia_phi.AAC.1